MNEMLSFDDVLIVPKFSTIGSRADVNLRQSIMGFELDLPIISSNMDTITGPEMATAMGEAGGVGALHRFCSIEENVKMFQAVASRLPIVSLGVSTNDLERADALYEVGARNFCIDVAHGASRVVLLQYEALAFRLGPDAKIMVGNFATGKSIEDFCSQLYTKRKPSAFKVGIGGGSMCTTRIVTGCGMPTLASIIDCVKTRYPIVADGGMRTSGDIAKALAAGATAVMLGGMLSGTYETPGDIIWGESTKDVDNKISIPTFKKYRGSASSESYAAQGKAASHRSSEGEATLVPCKGPVADVIQQIEGGLRSALSYVGANDLTSFRNNAKLIQITSAGIAESRAHGVIK